MLVTRRVACAVLLYPTFQCGCQVLGVTGVVSRLARALPGSIAAGLQLGLGLSLAGLGLRFLATFPRISANRLPWYQAVSLQPDEKFDLQYDLI
jgi:hypothetical protein